MAVIAPAAVVEAARSAERVVVLSGAGMSAESGVPTFRDAQSGLWERFDPSELATPAAWEADREFVWAWYLWRVSMVRRVRPNAGHRALASWSRAGQWVDIATQNVDDLHERAGSVVAAHVHGSLLEFRCEECERRYVGPVDSIAAPVERAVPPRCPCGAWVRPGVVWFGERLPEGAFDAAVEACLAADVALVVGTSGIVYPFADLPDLARGHGATVVEINPVETAVSAGVDHVWRATAAQALPALVRALGVDTPT